MNFQKKLCRFSVEVIIIMVTTLCLILSGQVNVNAASKILIDAKAKTAHLNKSLHINYLGLKNQGQWQAYIKEIRSTILKIPSSEVEESKKLIESINKAEALVNALSRINKVEKSMEINTLSIVNARQWTQYIILADYDLSKVDKVEFLEEYNELVIREDKCIQVIEKLEADFDIIFKKVLNLYFKAESSRNIYDANIAYEEAKKLGTCDESNYLEHECRTLLVRLGGIILSSDEKILEEAFEKLDDVLIGEGISITGSGADKLKEAVEKITSGLVKVEALLKFKNPITGDESYEVILYKGQVKTYPILIEFGSAKLSL